MINAIIFSKDRAAQLRLLIYSIQKNTPYAFKLNVIYKYSDESFKAGYEKVKQEFQGVCNFVEQTSDFKQDVLNLLKSDFEFSCFFTDDDIIYRQFDVNKVLDTLKNDDEVFCFSLRLGVNTTFCYAMNSPNVLKNYDDLGDIIKWQWNVHYLDFGYPLSVDGHVFRTKEITKLTKSVSFSNPNTYEAALQVFENFPREKMASFKHNVLVNTPNNIVNTVFKNRAGLTHAANVKDLNDDYLSGKVIHLESMDFSNVIGCHQEIEFKYKE
ncbi:MAG: hypothetical protein KatS3mg035_1152 [Bacteroidia bacterium]|nr:MAG: hypothetical protein KatS3mg035_1152 [Bacteroidia bacterium]